MDLTHLDDQHRPKMVDVSTKAPTTREATASGVITMSPAAFTAVTTEQVKKGPVLQTAIVAAILGAKKTPDLIPMCHPLLLSGVHCDVSEDPQTHSFKLFVTVRLSGNTGVEMEALTAVSIGLLTIYDMVKAIDKSMVIGPVQLEKKSGGKSGDFTRTDP